MTRYEVAEFRLAMEQGTLSDPILEYGMIKPGEDEESLLFSKGQACDNGLRLPLARIKYIDHLGKARQPGAGTVSIPDFIEGTESLGHHTAPDDCDCRQFIPQADSECIYVLVSENAPYRCACPPGIM